VPDGKSVVGLKLSPTKTVAAISTLRGLYTLSLSSLVLSPVSVSTGTQKEIYPDICWGSKGQLYAARLQGDILLYVPL
jgi:hypothetical protein